MGDKKGLDEETVASLKKLVKYSKKVDALLQQLGPIEKIASEEEEKEAKLAKKKKRIKKKIKAAKEKETGVVHHSDPDKPPPEEPEVFHETCSYPM